MFYTRRNSMVTTTQLLEIIGPKILGACPAASFLATLTHPGHYTVSVWNVPPQRRSEVERAVLPLNHGVDGVRVSVGLNVYTPTLTADLFAGTHNFLRRALHGPRLKRFWVGTRLSRPGGGVFKVSPLTLSNGILDTLRAIGDKCPIPGERVRVSNTNSVNVLGVKHLDTSLQSVNKSDAFSDCVKNADTSNEK